MTADATSPAAGGCHGAPWTRLGPIPVAGAWTDGVTPLTITSNLWGTQRILSYTTTSAITQNENSGVDALKLNKVVWTGKTSNQLYYCFVSSNQATAADAETHAGTATTTDLVTGCLGGAWTKLDAAP
jgi:hypothetical protein